jgi:putative nucleotidyltransferase with HDIG domain
MLRKLFKVDKSEPKIESNLEIVQPPELKRTISLDGKDISIGRDAGCDLHLDFPDISRNHARIFLREGRWLVEDCASKVGVLVNGERIGRRELSDGDLIKIGGIVLRHNGDKNGLSNCDVSHLHNLLEATRTISSSLVPEEVLERITDSVAAITGAERAFLMLVSENGELDLKVERNIERIAIESSEFKISRSVVTQTARTGRSVVIDNVPDGEGTESIETLGLKSVACWPLLLKKRVIGVIYTDSRKPNWIKELDVRMLEALASNAAVALENARLNQQLKDAFFNTSMALADAVEARDNYTAGHSRRVTDYSLLIGRAMGLGAEELETLRTSAILHDIGKIGIPDCILNKPGLLEPLEYETIKQHTVIGARILGHVPELSNVVPAVRHHHERMDGSGYPDGLSGEAIPLLARIIAVADAFDAITTTRVYKPTLPDSLALEELRRGSGTQFDPQVVDVFLKLYAEGMVVDDRLSA